ncbi:MAG: response regulator [Bdellovibrionales bacterium]|nr:response regulator [Bdellovibrionales bacterium]
MKSKVLNNDILVVDQDNLIHVMLSKLLYQYGAHVVSCYDSPSAIKACKEKVFKLIIVDPMLPSSFEGEDFIKEQRQFYSINKDTPIIVFTEDIDFVSRLSEKYECHPESKVGDLKKISEPIRQALGF